MKILKFLAICLLCFSIFNGAGARAEEKPECNDEYKVAISKASRLQKSNEWEESRSQLIIAESSNYYFSVIDKSSVFFLWSNYYLASDTNASVDKVIEYSLKNLGLAVDNGNIDPTFACATIIFKLKNPEILDANAKYKEMCIKRLSKGV
ncbi:hypothetical protein [Microbulbifer sp. JTAC008]|uniref:hypothetical protein n=1 Tax=unclassified Microbulbifer TaxID=2619833 RepID=UPI00403A2F62